LVHSGGGAGEAGVLGWISLVLAAPFVCVEAMQLKEAPIRYLLEGWNWVDLLAIVMAVHQLVDWLVTGRELSQGYAAATAALIYLKILAYLRGSKGTAALVTMLSKVVWDAKGFVLILLVVILAFSSSFFLLGAFDDPSESVFGTFTVMLGEFYLDDGKFQDGGSRFFFLGFVALVMIIMLNLLIAIISDTFERVVERQEAQFWKQLASLLQEIEHLFPRWVLAAAPPAECAWLHVLERVSAGGSSGQESWSGRVRQLKHHVDQSEKKLQQQIGEVKEQVGKVEQQVGKVEQQVGEILALLLRQAPANGAPSD
jgi:hypothetical protein